MASRRVDRAGRRLERRALRRGASPSRSGRRDHDRRARRSPAASARTTPACRRRRCCGRPRSLAAATSAPGAAEAVTGEIDVERVALVAGPGDGRARRLVARRLDRGPARRARARRGARRATWCRRSRRARDSSTTSSWSRPDPCRRFHRSRVIGDVDYWTNREAIWASSIPASLVVLGGGARRCRARAVLPPDGRRRHARREQRPSPRSPRCGRRVAARRAVRAGRDPRSRRDPRRQRRGGRRWSSPAPRPVRRSTRLDCWSQPDAGRASKGSGSSRSASRSRSAA